MQQNSFVAPSKHIDKSIKFWLFKQNVLLGQQTEFCCKHFFLSVRIFAKIYIFFISSFIYSTIDTVDACCGVILISNNI